MHGQTGRPFPIKTLSVNFAYQMSDFCAEIFALHRPSDAQHGLWKWTGLLYRREALLNMDVLIV